MKKAIFILLLYLFSSSLIYPEDSYMFSDPSQQIKVMEGEKFGIVLGYIRKENYCWQLAKPLDQSILKLVKSYIGESQKEIVFVFKAISKGKTMLSFKYSREGEKDMYPLESRMFIVEVE